MIWARMLAYITGTVDQELLLRNEYLAAENRILRAQIKGRLLLCDAEKATLAEIAHRLKREALEELAAVAKPDTLLAWYRKLIANKFAGSKFCKSSGRPRIRGLITYYVLFFIHLESRRICLAGVTRHPNQEWMEQMARNVTMEDCGFLIHRKYLLNDHDSKYCSSFRQLIEAGSVKTLTLPPRSPNLNAYAERWVRSVREECLAKLILLGEGSLRRALRHYEAHYHEERNHQGKNNVLLFPLPTQAVRGDQEKVRCRKRLGGLVRYYQREAA